MKKDDLIDRLLDEEDDSTVTLYDERGRAVEMAQMALIAVEGEPYVLLAPIELLERGETDCLIAFKVFEDGVREVDDPSVESEIFAEYERLFNEGKKED